MDMYINRWDSQLLYNEEIDLVCEAIENVLFGELLEEENVLLSIHCVKNESDLMDRVICCRNKATREFVQLSYSVTAKLFDDVYTEIYDYPVPQVYNNHTVIHNTDIQIFSCTLKLQVGYIFFFAAIDDSMLTAMAHQSIYGLALTICKMLSLDDTGADRLAQILPNTKMKNICDTERESICNRVNQYFDSDQKAVADWREYHL